jgi:hypothetical protein
MIVHLIADEVVGAHPHARSLSERSALATQESFSWVSSSGVGGVFKCGLVCTLDLEPLRSPVSAKVNTTLSHHFQLTHTLQELMRSSTLQRASPEAERLLEVRPLVQSLYLGIRKESAYGSPEAVRALA